MDFSYCPNCGKSTGHKRALSWGTFFAVIITFGFWILMIPFYPKRCIVCGSSESPKRTSPKEYPYNSSATTIEHHTEHHYSLIKWILILLILIAIIGFSVSFIEQRSKEKERLEQQEKQASFLNNIDQHYQKLLALYKNNEIKPAAKQLRLFRKYRQLNYKDVLDINRKVTIGILEKRVRKIPVSKVSENLEIYQRLSSLDPQNQRYKKKVAFYKAEFREQEQQKEKRLAFQNEPDGFRGIKWGTNLSDLPDMQYLSSKRSAALYTIKGDKMKIGDADLDAVYYGFSKGRFFSVIIQFNSLPNYHIMKQTLFRKYGKGESLSPAEGYKWPGPSVNIVLGYSKHSQKGRVTYLHKPTFDLD